VPQNRWIWCAAARSVGNEVHLPVAILPAPTTDDAAAKMINGARRPCDLRLWLWTQSVAIAASVAPSKLLGQGGTFVSHCGASFAPLAISPST